MSNGTEIEPLLTPDDDRFVVLPVKYQDLYQMYKSAVACFWTVSMDAVSIFYYFYKISFKLCICSEVKV
jgi:hypothetical protein